MNICRNINGIVTTVNINVGNGSYVKTCIDTFKNAFKIMLTLKISSPMAHSILWEPDNDKQSLLIDAPIASVKKNIRITNNICNYLNTIGINNIVLEDILTKSDSISELKNKLIELNGVIVNDSNESYFKASIDLLKNMFNIILELNFSSKKAFSILLENDNNKQESSLDTAMESLKKTIIKTNNIRNSLNTLGINNIVLEDILSREYSDGINELKNKLLALDADIVNNTTKKNVATSTVDIEKFYSQGNVYLVSTMIDLPDELLTRGIHKTSVQWKLFTRLSVHFYQNDKVFPHGQGNWEDFKYILIVKSTDISKYLYSVEWSDTVALYGIDYNGTDVYIGLPASDNDKIQKLQRWLDPARIVTYEPCIRDVLPNDAKIYRSDDKTVCKTSRDVAEEMLVSIFTKVNKKITKGAGLGIYIVSDPNGQNECYFNGFNNSTALNIASGDANIYETEYILQFLNAFTDNKFYYDDDFVIAAGFDTPENINKLLIYLTAFKKNKIFDGSQNIFVSNNVIKNIYTVFYRKIYASLGKYIDISFEEFVNIIEKIYTFALKYLKNNHEDDNKLYNESILNSLDADIVSESDITFIEQNAYLINDNIINLYNKLNSSFSHAYNLLSTSVNDYIIKINTLFSKYPSIEDVPIVDQYGGNSSSYKRKYLKYVHKRSLLKRY